MRLRSWMWLPLFSAMLVMVGCSGGVELNFHESRSQPKRVIVVDVDRCDHSYGCHHYYSGTRWVTLRRGHVHGPGCGHYRAETHWVLTGKPAYVNHGHVKKVKKRATKRVIKKRAKKTQLKRVHHVHDAHCGCVHDRGRWVKVRSGHVHGPRCGHSYISGRWTIRH